MEKAKMIEKLDQILVTEPYECQTFKKKKIKREALKQPSGQMGLVITIYDVCECFLKPTNIDEKMNCYLMAVSVWRSLLKQHGKGE